MNIRFVLITMGFLFISGLQSLYSATIIFDNKSRHPLFISTGISPRKPLRTEWIRAGVRTRISLPFHKVKFFTIFKQSDPENSPKALTAIKVLHNFSVSSFGKAYILYFDPKHTNVIKNPRSLTGP